MKFNSRKFGLGTALAVCVIGLSSCSGGGGDGASKNNADNGSTQVAADPLQTAADAMDAASELNAKIQVWKKDLTELKHLIITGQGVKDLVNGTSVLEAKYKTTKADFTDEAIETIQDTELKAALKELKSFFDFAERINQKSMELGRQWQLLGTDLENWAPTWIDGGSWRAYIASIFDGEPGLKCNSPANPEAKCIDQIAIDNFTPIKDKTVEFLAAIHNASVNLLPGVTDKAAEIATELADKKSAVLTDTVIPNGKLEATTSLKGADTEGNNEQDFLGFWHTVSQRFYIEIQKVASKITEVITTTWNQIKTAYNNTVTRGMQAMELVRNIAYYKELNVATGKYLNTVVTQYREVIAKEGGGQEKVVPACSTLTDFTIKIQPVLGTKDPTWGDWVSQAGGPTQNKWLISHYRLGKIRATTGDTSLDLQEYKVYNSLTTFNFKNTCVFSAFSSIKSPGGLPGALNAWVDCLRERTPSTEELLGQVKDVTSRIYAFATDRTKMIAKNATDTAKAAAEKVIQTLSDVGDTAFFNAVLFQTDNPAEPIKNAVTAALQDVPAKLYAPIKDFVANIGKPLCTFTVSTKAMPVNDINKKNYDAFSYGTKYKVISLVNEKKEETTAFDGIATTGGTGGTGGTTTGGTTTGETTTGGTTTSGSTTSENKTTTGNTTENKTNAINNVGEKKTPEPQLQKPKSCNLLEKGWDVLTTLFGGKKDCQ